MPPSRATAVCPALLAAALVAATPSARAQTSAFNPYRPPASADDLTVTERAWVTPHLRVGALLVGDWAPNTTVPPALRAALRHRVTAHAVVALGLFDRAQIALTLPLVAHQDAQGRLPSPEVGDPGLDARVRVLGHARRGTARLALAAGVTFPVTDGNGARGGFTVSPRALAEFVFARDFVFALNVGALVRTQGAQLLTARAGVALPLRRSLVITAEALLTTPFGDLFGASSTALELLGGLRGVTRAGLVLGAAAGPGLMRGEGASDVRVLATVGYAPRPPEALEGSGDRDADGVLDDVDACPDTPQGARPDRRRRGCPREDRDRDLVDDADDACPDTPQGDEADPERRGCPLRDRDGDGVRDADDACPLEPMGERADRNHRGCPLLDGDRDGFADGDDACPVEPAGAHPDAARPGCPDPDPDRDGIPNARDACPEEAGPRTRDAATNGCPTVFVRGDRVVILQQPRFATNRDAVLPESFALLGEVAAVLEAHPEITRVEVAGHTDDVGPDDRNLDLSQRRAASVRDWLVGHGVAPERLVARGYGETRPMVDGATARGRALNRRVEFVIVGRAE